MSLLDNFKLPRKLDHAVRDVRDLSRRTFDFASDVYECLRLLKSVADEMTTRIDDVITSVADAVTDHGDLTGLSDDDHTQYSLVSGSRAFTGTVGGVTPVSGSDLATKDYVDGAIPAAYTDEQAQDAVGNILDNSTTIFWLYQDGIPAIAANIIADSIMFSHMQEIATDRLIGRDTAGTGNPEEIALDNTLEFTGSGSIQRAALTGDVTANAGSNTTTIPNGTIGNAKLANMAGPSIKGRASGTGAPGDLTPTATTALLDNLVGDSGSGGTKGLAPAPAAGDAAARKFLRADGTWAAVQTHQTLSAASSTVTYNVLNGLNASVTLSSGVSSSFDIDFTNLVAGMRGTLRITTSGAVDLSHIEVDGVQGAFTESGAAPSSFLNDGETAILEWFYDGDLYVWIDAQTLVNYAA